METRRDFMKASAAAAVVSQTVLGANDRIQMAIIGTGGRGGQVYDGFAAHKDQVFLAACDVAADRLDAFVTSRGKMDTYTDYRRILDRKDIDAVLITTPDHQHAPILIAALQAGKDAYVEKPISNTIEPAQRMVDAVHKSNRIVQVGLQQRSWDHFKEAVKLVQDGYIGNVLYAENIFSNYMPTPVASPPEPVPEGLDWDGWLGPAPKKPYTRSRQRGWRAFYDYGGGMITDWGVHLVDIAHMGLKADDKVAKLTSASSAYIGVPNPDPDQTPNSFLISWEYDNFVMGFKNAEIPNPSEPEFPLWGTYFYGNKGVLLVNRMGYRVWPRSGGFMGGGRAPQQGRGGEQGRGAPQARGGQQPVRGQASMPQTGVSGPPIEAKNYINPRGIASDATSLHVRNFLDCLKSREQPVATIDIGYHSSLPCIIALLAIRNRRQYAWKNNTAVPA